MTVHPSTHPSIRPAVPRRTALDGVRLGRVDGTQRTLARILTAMTCGTDRKGATVNPDQPTGRVPSADHESRALGVGLSSALWTLSTVASLMAATGQLGFADWADIHGLARYGVPLILECFAVVLLLLGYRQGRRRRSPYLLWLLAGIVGGFAVYTNVVHAGHRAGLVFGAASVVALLSWFIKLRLDLTYYWQKIGHIPPARPKLRQLFLVAPRLATRSWIIAVRRRVTTTDEVVTLAETWIAIYDDSREVGIPRRLAKRTAWRTVTARSGGPVVDLPRTTEVEKVTVTVRPADQAAPSAPVRPEPSTPDPSTRPEPKKASTDQSIMSRATSRPPRPDARPRSGVRLVWSPAVRENAAALRDRYGTALPSSVRKVREDMKWSNDRAKPAVQAYLAGADQKADGDEEERAS